MIEPWCGSFWQVPPIRGLQEEIARLRTKQIAAENMAALMGMTCEDSEQYKKRALRLRILVRKLAILPYLEVDKGTNREQGETQEIAGQFAENGRVL